MQCYTLSQQETQHDYLLI